MHHDVNGAAERPLSKHEEQYEYAEYVSIWQTQMRHPQIELYVEFETLEAVVIQNYLDIDDDRATVYEGLNSDSEEDFEATYEAGDEDEDGDLRVEAVAKNAVVHPSRM
ncbi:hypothetical protein AHAS_Ahas07G0046200 [Arachis hypogaea]